jgi:hypothetical protein
MAKVKLNRIFLFFLSIGIFVVLITSCSTVNMKTSDSSDLHPAFTVANNCYGYIDDSGIFVIKQQFKEAEDFDLEEYAVVTTNDNKQGVIDKTGNYTVKPIYNFIDDLKNGIARFGTNNGEGILNITTGKIIIKPANYFNISNFNEGITIAQGYNKDSSIISYAFDTTGKLLFKINGSFSDFHNGMSILQDNSSRLYGYVDKSGKIVIKPQYNYAENFNNGKAEIFTTDNKCYYINKIGKIIGTGNIDDINNPLYEKYDDGYYIKGSDIDQSYTLYNKSGKAVIKDAYLIKMIDSNYYAVFPKQQNVYFNEGNNNPKAIFDNKGKQIADYIYNNVNELENGKIAVVTNNETYLVDNNLNEIKSFPKIKGSWYLTLSGELIKAVLDNNVGGSETKNIRYYTMLGKLVYQSDGIYVLNNGAKLSCVNYWPRTSLSITYPCISNLKDKNTVNNINEKLKKYFTDNDFTKQFSKVPIGYGYFASFSYNQISDILHVQEKGQEQIGNGNPGANIDGDFYFNLSSGKEYTIADLFDKKKDYKTYVNKVINKDNDINAPQCQIDDISGFIINKNTINIYGNNFNCDLLYSEIDSYIDKSGDLWKNINKW